MTDQTDAGIARHPYVATLREAFDSALAEQCMLTRQATERAQQAEAEVARLRAGEADQPVELGAVLTPATWIRKFNDASPERRLAWADRILREAEADARCFALDHDGAVEQLREAWQTWTALARVRELHKSISYGDKTACAYCSERDYPNYEVLWPCPTMAALDLPDDL